MKRFSFPKALFLTIAFSLVISVAAAAQPAKNVILMIGDGMGHTHRLVGRYIDGHPLAMDLMPVDGAMSNYSADSIVTDSAASATAMATGYKTNNGMISITPDNKKRTTILEKARDAGKATGMVVTVTMTHATPAAFGSHVSGRGDESEIADQYTTEGIQVLFGGGTNFFLPKSQGSARKDEKNLIDQFKSNGYQYAWDAESLKAVNKAPALGLFSPSYMAPEVDRDATNQPSLADMTIKALDLLDDDPDGFFLMVEGSQIDSGSHDGDPVHSMGDLLAFDKAVAVAAEFASKIPDTLVVVCADHETGGMIIKNDSSIAKLKALKNITATGSFTAEALGKEKDIEKVKEIVKQISGIILTDSEAKSIANATTSNRKSTINKLVSKRAGITWSTGDHSAAPVPVMAVGSNMELFGGWYDNTELPKKIAQAMELEL